MPKEDDKILRYNPGEKSMKVLFIIYFRLESLLEKMSTHHNKLTTKINKHTPSVYSLFIDYHFIIKELAEVFKGKFKNLWENTEKYITFSVPIKEELDNGKSITCKIKFIDSFRFMSSSLSYLVYNLSEGLHSDKCIDCKSFLDYMSVNGIAFKNDQRSCTQLIFRCFVCKKGL